MGDLGVVGVQKFQFGQVMGGDVIGQFGILWVVDIYYQLFGFGLKLGVYLVEFLLLVGVCMYCGGCVVVVFQCVDSGCVDMLVLFDLG